MNQLYSNIRNTIVMDRNYIGTTGFYEEIRDGQYLNTLYLNTVFKYISCIYTCISNTFG